MQLFHIVWCSQGQVARVSLKISGTASVLPDVFSAEKNGDKVPEYIVLQTTDEA
jgi:hypothetical protein